MSSKTDKRAKEILRLLLRHGKTSVEDLTAEPDGLAGQHSPRPYTA